MSKKKVVNNNANANPQPEGKNDQAPEKKPGMIKKVLLIIGKVIVGVFAALGVIGTIGAISKNFGGGDADAEVEAPADDE
jgi:hypothetical protein